MRARTRDRLLQNALRPRGLTAAWWSRRATARLCSLLATDDDPALVEAVARIAWSAPHEEASHQALAALTRRGDDPSLVGRVLATFEQASTVVSDAHWHYDLTSPAASWLFAPAPDAVHIPRIRLVWCLDTDPAPLPAGPTRAGLASWIVQATLSPVNEPLRDRLVELLHTTDQPDLLRTLEMLFSIAVTKSLRYGAGERALSLGPLTLWWDDQPALLTSLILANPNLPLESADAAGQPFSIATPRILIAILKGHPDPLPDSVGTRYPNAAVNALLDGADMPSAPATLADACRRILRTLPAGPVREELCKRAALTDVAEARAAVVDASYLPADEQLQPAFLFLTEQWARYDQTDPDGSRLRSWCAEHARDAATGYRTRLTEVASANGRPDPCPPAPTPSGRSSNAIGAWITDYGAGSGFGHF